MMFTIYRGLLPRVRMLAIKHSLQKVGEISSDYFFVRLLGTEEDTHTPAGVCLIRLPEMYYILAEATYDQDKEKAMRYFNDVRNSRGLNDYKLRAEVTSREESLWS